MALGACGTVEAQRPGVFIDNRTLIPGRATDTYRVVMVAGETGRVSMVGDGRTDLDLFVYDEFGNLVASDIGLTDIASVSWFVPRTQTYTVRVVNLGSVSNFYSIRSN